MKKLAALLLSAILMAGCTACTRSAANNAESVTSVTEKASTEKESEEETQLENQTESDEIPSEKKEKDSQTAEIRLSDSEKEILLAQAELLTKQIVSTFHPQLPEESALKADDETIERFWLTIGIYEKSPHYPYPDTCQLTQDGVCHLPKETVDTINKEVFARENWEPTIALKFNSEEQTYEYATGFGVSAYGFEDISAAFQNNDSELVLSYELWSDPNFPDYHKLDDVQTSFSVQQREDNSCYLQYEKTESHRE